MQKNTKEFNRPGIRNVVEVDDKFLAATVIVLFTSKMEKSLCDMVMNITGLFINCDLIDYEYEKFLKTIDEGSTGINQSIDRIKQQLLKILRPRKKMTNTTNKNVVLSIPDLSLDVVYKMVSWPESIAPFVWEWIHIIANFIDLNGGQNEKIYFIEFIERIIHCSICIGHYQDNKNLLINSLKFASLTDIFLMLHTTLTVDVNANFILNTELINNQYKSSYFKRFCKILNEQHSTG